MVLKSSFTVLAVATLALFSYAPQAEAHSWADCIDWKFNTPSKQDWSDKGGHCVGYARRFPLGKGFGTLDSADPNRQYQQDHKDPNSALPCSDGHHGAEHGSDETLASPPSKAYGGKYGAMTVTTVGDTLCVRWPAKNHAEKNEDNTVVQINLSKKMNGADPTQQDLIKSKVAELPFKNCGTASTTDKRPCGGCFKVPVRASGIYLLQWRWMLNPGEWYTSCADIQIGSSGAGKAAHR
ncbi:hypothetical protein BGZ99_008190, partial [Dissophora globulifera]